MELKIIDINYSVIIAKVDKTTPIVGADKIHTITVLGNYIVTQKSVSVGDVGIYFPVECKISDEFLRNNNLYRKSELNVDGNKKGYIEENGRVRYVKLRGQVSEGLFLPLSSLSYIENINMDKLKIGDYFNSIIINKNEFTICEKYIIPRINTTQKQDRSKRNNMNKLMEEFVVDNQFRFHSDTEQLYRNLDKINITNDITISYKLHGSSGISSKILLKRKLNILERLLLKFNLNINQYEYGYIYSSGKPKSKLPKGIKNKYLNKNKSFYEDDIWLNAHNSIEHLLDNGITLYYEIVGFTKTGSYIQKDYDYGCKQPKEDGRYIIGEHFDIYVYRITYTNDEGKIFEFNTNQIKHYCERKNIKNIPIIEDGRVYSFVDFHSDDWRGEFFDYIIKNYNGNKCFICNNDVPEEGVVIRLEDEEGFVAYKQKSKEFYEYETKVLDENISNIENE